MKKYTIIVLVLLLSVFPQLGYSASTDTCNDTDTVLMLHANGTDASTTFTDNSVSNHTLTANGDAQLDTAQQKFGTASGLFDGTGDYLSTPDSSDFDLGSSDFTIEAQVRFNSVAANRLIIAQYSSVSNQRSWAVYWDTTNVLTFLYSTTGASGAVKNFSWTPSTNTWYHVVIIRNGNNLKAFIDGTQIGTTQDVTGLTFFNSTANLEVGMLSDGNTYPFNGWIDELRLIKGNAVWTSNFTSPTVEYSDTCPSRGRVFSILGE
jgi:hypothetical protein